MSDGKKYDAEYLRQWKAKNRDHVLSRQRDWNRKSKGQEEAEKQARAKKARDIVEWNRQWLRERKQS